MAKYDRCPICHKDFFSCPHTVGEADRHKERSKKSSRVGALLKDLADDAPITKKILLRVLKEMR